MEETKGVRIGAFQLLLALVGSPAHAGIDPKETLSARSYTRFPRTRGDRPQGTDENAKQALVPRTRGIDLC